MKNLAVALVFLFAFSFNAEAQKKRKERKPKFTVEQQANLAIKKMTLALDLSNKQQNQIKPLLVSKFKAREDFMEKRKEARKNRQRPSAEEMYAMKSKQLDNQIFMKNKMKDILNKEQFEKFEKMAKRRKMMAMKKKKEMMKKGRMMKRRMNEDDGK